MHPDDRLRNPGAHADRHHLHALLIRQPTILELILAGTIVCCLVHAVSRTGNILKKGAS